MRASLRVVVTLLVVAAAVLAGIWLWRYYMLSPWTRDARVRADVVVVAPEFDISSDALQRLDAALADVTVTVAETPPPN